MKAFQLNQEHRHTLAHQLTVQAIKKSATECRTRLEKLQADYWEAHAKAMEKRLGMDRKAFRPLIADGILTHTCAIVPETWRRGDVGGAQWRDVTINVHNRCVGKVLADPAIGLIGSAGVLGRYLHRSVCADLVFRHSGGLPRCDGMEKITRKDFQHRLDAAANKLDRITQAAKDFYANAEAILSSCRTSRQLADLFPEAAKMLPPPPEKNTQLVAQDQANKVRDMLRTGIPA